MQHSFLKVVTSESQHWIIRTRVVRFSQYLSDDQPPIIRRLDLILLDEEGTTMEGQIPEKWISLFQSKLKERSVYYIEDFYVCNARTAYRPVDHPYMMRFTAHTKVREIQHISETFPMYACTPVTYDVLRDRVPTTEYCSDAIGLFTGCTHVREQQTKKGIKTLRNVYITDGRETVTVALWNQHAQAFDADNYMEMAKHGPVIFLFVAVTSRIYEGKLSLQGSALCKWYANPELPEVAALRDSCAGKFTTPTWVGPSAGQAIAERTSVAQLSQITNPHRIFSNRYIIDAKIKNIVPNRPWWYLACELCNTTVQSQGNTYKCASPKCSGTMGAPRYRLAVIVADPTLAIQEQDVKTIELVLFGSTAQEIIGTPVNDLIASSGGLGEFLPPHIRALYGKQYELRISVSSISFQSTSITYQVDTVLGIGNTPPLTAPSLQLQTGIQQSEAATASTQPQQHVTDLRTTITSSSPEYEGAQLNQDESRRSSDDHIAATPSTDPRASVTSTADDTSKTSLPSTPVTAEIQSHLLVADQNIKKHRHHDEASHDQCNDNKPSDPETTVGRRTRRRLDTST
ncbi:unnamed protein product [Urochloa decumbens]|uniref:Replication protein A 70 kDa DNA-binding subunit B/D first OB fold domain-containing protein n=1 Tax=Urochloa decumbens TaxID=240449 RepID=A0ABC8XRW3_9POAL